MPTPFLNKKIAELSAAQKLELADRLEEAVAHRGLFIRFAAGCEIRKLRVAAQKDT